MNTNSEQLQVTGIPPYINCWSAISIPGFAVAILDRWQRNYGTLPSRFAMVACPQVEINAMGGLPSRVHELTNSRVRIQHFTGCHRPYLVILLFGEDAEIRRDEIQHLLPWSEGYLVESQDGITQLRFIDAIEEIDHDG